MSAAGRDQLAERAGRIRHAQERGQPAVRAGVLLRTGGARLHQREGWSVDGGARCDWHDGAAGGGPERFEVCVCVCVCRIVHG